jgi:hypothetical protein
MKLGVLGAFQEAMKYTTGLGPPRQEQTFWQKRQKPTIINKTSQEIYMVIIKKLWKHTFDLPAYMNTINT